MTVSLLEELGGADGMAIAVDDLYQRLLADPVIAPYFREVNVVRTRSHMTDFLISALDGPTLYEGRDLDIAHADLGVTDDAFDVTVSHLLDALKSRGVRPGLLDIVLGRIAPLRPYVVEHR